MRRTKTVYFRCCACLWLMCAALLPFAAQAEELATLLTRAAELRQGGQPAQAFAALREQEADYAGDPDFDMQLGLAAVEAGEPAYAVFAFERVLLVQPRNERARVELARARYLAGNLGEARQSFEQVLASHPPALVRSRIEQYLAAIDRAEQSQQRQLSGYLDMRLGHDSNVNSATTLQEVEIPALGIVTLDDDGQAVSDEFMELAAGATLAWPFSRQTSLFAELSLKDRENREQHDSDLRSLGASAGPVFKRAQHTLRLPLVVQELYLDDAHYRHLASIGPAWSYDFSARRRLAVFAQAGTLRYPDDELRDARLLLGGTSWTEHFQPQSLLLVGSAYVGDESADHADGDYNGRRYYGVRADLQWLMNARHTPYLSVIGQWTEYDAENPLFLVTRDDDYYEFRAGWDYSMDANWSAYAEASFVRSESNVVLYDYNRNQVYAGVRYRFD